MNRKLLFTSLLSLSLLLSGCGKKDAKNASANSKIENSITNEDLSLDDDIKETKETPVKVNKELLKELMTDSDYITRVKVQVDAENKTANNFIEDYKGDLSNVEIKLPKTLTPSREYIIFYKDGPEGKIVPTDSDKSFIEIKGSDDGNLNFIESYYLTDNSSNISDSSGPKAVKKPSRDSELKDQKSSTKSDSKDSSKKSNTKESKSSKDSESKDKNSDSKDSSKKSSTKESKSSKDSESKDKNSDPKDSSKKSTKKSKSSKDSESKDKTSNTKTSDSKKSKSSN